MTFFEWLFDIHRPAPQIVRVPLTPLKAIENELERVHEELSSFQGGTHNSQAYLAVVATLDKLHVELVRRSQEDKE